MGLSKGICRCLLTGCPLLAFPTTSAASVRMVLIAMSSVDRGEKLAIFHNDIQRTIGMGDGRNGWGLAVSRTRPRFIRSIGSRNSPSRFSLDRRRSQRTLSIRDCECILKSPTGSVRSRLYTLESLVSYYETSGLQRILPGPRGLPRRQMAQMDRRMQQ